MIKEQKFDENRVIIRKIRLKDVEELFVVKKKSFQSLLEKYEDYQTSPSCEPLEKLYQQLEQQEVEYYVISASNSIIGGVRVCQIQDNKYKIAPIYLLPNKQKNGIGTKIMRELFEMYPDATWTLDSIVTEEKNCAFYKKVGFVPTGKRYQLNQKLMLEEYVKKADK